MTAPDVRTPGGNRANAEAKVEIGSRHSAATGRAEQDELQAEGAEFAAAWLERLNAGAAAPGELATLVQFLADGPMLRGACARIETAVRGSRR